MYWVGWCKGRTDNGGIRIVVRSNRSSTLSYTRRSSRLVYAAGVHFEKVYQVAVVRLDVVYCHIFVVAVIRVVVIVTVVVNATVEVFNY